MRFYRVITTIFHWIAPLILKYRLLKGKEDKNRYFEKLGIYSNSVSRPQGFLVRIHGASIGETISALPIIKNLLEEYSDISIMVTSNTVTSANLMSKKLPHRCFHIYAPIDTPQAVEKFYQSYAPNIEIILDSEIWPNCLIQSYKNKIPVIGINTRLSDKSMAYWKKNSEFLKDILLAYHHFFVQNEKIAHFLSLHFNGEITICDNLKWATYPEFPSSDMIQNLQKQIANRFAICLLSTHEPEEKNITQLLKQHKFFDNKQNLLIIVPRHPHRKNNIITELKSIDRFNIQLRSDNQNLSSQTQIYIADTLGEVMLWSYLADIIFMGHSFSLNGGGHNPIEPATIGKPLMVGNKIGNFTEIYNIFKNNDACVFSDTIQDLVCKMMLLRDNQELRQRLSHNSQMLCEQYREHALMILQDIYHIINRVKHDTNT